MKPSTFAGLVLVAVVALVIAVASYSGNTRLAQPKVSGAPLAPGLVANVGRIAKIEVKQGDKSVTLMRDAKGGWGLADREGYPIKLDAVRGLLVKLAEANLVEPKTKVKDRYGLLELDDPTAKDAKSRLVRVADDKGSAISEVIVGKKRMDAFGASRSGTYVRRPGEDQTWLASSDIEASANIRDWVVPGILDLQPAKISAVTITVPGEQPLKLARDAAGGAPKFNLAGLPEGKKLKESAGLDAIVRAAGSLELDDVRKSDGKGAADAGTVKIEGDGGLVVNLRFMKAGEDTWVALAATGEGDAKAQAEEINKRAAGWDFKLPSAKAGAILKRSADLIEGS